MSKIEFEKFSINKFWDKTPNPLKYILVFVLFICTAYFIFSKKLDDNNVEELSQMKEGITATYKLINNFEQFKVEQDEYNRQILEYLKNLHSLIEELNETTNKKFEIIIKSKGNNAEQIIEKINMLNESFIKISKIYQKSIQTPKIKQDNNKVIVIQNEK